MTAEAFLSNLQDIIFLLLSPLDASQQQACIEQL